MRLSTTAFDRDGLDFYEKLGTHKLGTGNRRAGHAGIRKEFRPDRAEFRVTAHIRNICRDLDDVLQRCPRFRKYF